MYIPIQKIRQYAVYIAALVLLVLALAPIRWTFVDGSFSVLGHLLGVAVVALALAVTLEKEKQTTEETVILAFASAAISCLFWILIELIQVFVPNHGTEFGDAVIDIVGAFLGFTIILVERRIFTKIRKTA